MSRSRNPNISRAVEDARELLRKDPDQSIAQAARTVGLNYQTLRYRLSNDPPEAHYPDGLPEDPTDASELPVFVRDYSSSANHRIYPIGDLHVGSPQHAGDRLDEWLDFLVESSAVSMLNTGDNLNCALKDSKSEAFDDVLTVQAGRRLLTEKFKPLAEADLIDAVIDGNHEERVYRATGDSPNSAVCDALGINYSRAACVVRYLVGDQSYDLYLRHGTGGTATSMGAAVNRLEKQERIIDADVYVSGHTHTQVAFPKNIFVPDEDGEFVRKKRLFVCSGSFLAYEDYAASAGYPPAHVGAPRIFLDGRKHDMHGSV